MATKLEKALKRELDIDGKPYTITISPEGVKGISLFVVPKFLVNEDGSLDARKRALSNSWPRCSSTRT